MQALNDLGYKTIGRKTSRSILYDWGISLEKINTDPALTARFQQEISQRKLDDETQASCSSEIYFTERTHADLYVYALYAMGMYNGYSDWLDSYYEQCKKNNNDTYSHIFYLPHGQFKIEADGVRMHNARYSRAIDRTMREMTLEMIQQNDYSRSITFIESHSVEDRVKEITQKLSEITKRDQ